MALIAYARTSTSDQKNSIQTQVERFTAMGVDPDLIFVEQRSGKSAEDRPKLQEMLRTIRKGDTLIVSKVDRLARSSKDLFDILEKVKAKGATFKALDQPEIDTTTAHGELVFGILGVVAQFERAIINERRIEGVRRAFDRGVKFGPPVKMTDDVVASIREDRAAGTPVRDIIKKHGLSKASVFRALAKEQPTN